MDVINLLLHSKTRKKIPINKPTLPNVNKCMRVRVYKYVCACNKGVGSGAVHVCVCVCVCACVCVSCAIKPALMITCI
jgi:hypothetical protein